MTTDIGLITALLAGVLSISSPCVLPLVPLYLAHIAGVSLQPDAAIDRRRVMVNALAYVLGFSLVFIALGVALGATGALVSGASVVSRNRTIIVQLGGLLLIVLGLHQIGLVRIGFLDREMRMDAGKLPGGQATSSFVIGVTFGAGWSPCVGPILGTILTMAASQGDITRSALLLAVYAAGLGIPFLLAAFAFSKSPAIIKRLQRHAPALASFSGAVMIAVGVIMVLGIYQQVFAEIIRAAPWTPWEPSL